MALPISFSAYRTDTFVKFLESTFHGFNLGSAGEALEKSARLGIEDYPNSPAEIIAGNGKA